MASSSRAAQSSSSSLPAPQRAKGTNHGQSEDPSEQLSNRIASRIKTRLENDHRSVLKPDVDTPFVDVEDVVTRLLPYHVYQHPKEDLDFIIRGHKARWKGKAKATPEQEEQEHLRREIAETRFALSCAKRLKSLEDRFTRIRRKDDRHDAPSDQNYILENLVYESDRTANAALQSELQTARQELLRAKPPTTTATWPARISTAFTTTTSKSQTNSPVATPPGAYTFAIPYGRAPQQAQHTQQQQQQQAQLYQFQFPQFQYVQTPATPVSNAAAAPRGVPVSSTMAVANATATAILSRGSTPAPSTKPTQSTVPSSVATSAAPSRQSTPATSISTTTSTASMSASASATTSNGAPSSIPTSISALPTANGEPTIIPVQLPLTSLPVLQALGILPPPGGSTATVSRAHTPATLLSTTATTATVRVAVSELTPPQMSGLAVILGGLMGRQGQGSGAPQQQQQQNGSTAATASNAST